MGLFLVSQYDVLICPALCETNAVLTRTVGLNSSPAITAIRDTGESILEISAGPCVVRTLVRQVADKEIYLPIGIGNKADTDDDNDGMPDGFETAAGFNPLDPTDAAGDADGDGFTNLEEFQAGTDPHDPDDPPPFGIDPPPVRKVPVAIFVILGEDEE